MPTISALAKANNVLGEERFDRLSRGGFASDWGAILFMIVLTRWLRFRGNPVVGLGVCCRPVSAVL